MSPPTPMGRKPIGEAAMSAAERQRRRRQRLGLALSSHLLPWNRSARTNLAETKFLDRLHTWVASGDAKEIAAWMRELISYRDRDDVTKLMEMPPAQQGRHAAAAPGGIDRKAVGRTMLERMAQIREARDRAAAEKVRQAKIAAAKAHPDKGGSHEASVRANAELARARDEEKAYKRQKEQERRSEERAMHARKKRSRKAAKR